MDATPRRPQFLASIQAGAQPGPLRLHPAQPAARRPEPPPAAQPAPGAGRDDREARREALERVAGALETLKLQSSRLAEQARADALEIGFQVARKVLEMELSAGAEPLFALVKAAIRRAGDSRRIAVRVAPEDASTLQGEAGRAALDGVCTARIEVFPDPALRPGDCLVETDYGQIDGRLETRLAELRRAVEQATEGAA